MSAVKHYVQSALEKEHLIASLVEYIKETNENGKCVDFQFHNPKLRQ